MFRPVPGRYREGKQLYVVGSKQVIIIIIIIITIIVTIIIIIIIIAGRCTSTGT